MKSFGSSVVLQPALNVSIDQFIDDLHRAVTEIQQKSEYTSYLWLRKSYLLTDSLSCQPIKMHNLNVTAAISNQWRRITLKSLNFLLSVLYFQNTEASAAVQWIRATNYWTGTQTMHIVHAILPRMGVWDVSLENVARFSYEYQGEYETTMKATISLIELRCIR